MVSPDHHQTPIDPLSSPRISFSANFLDDAEFISITPSPSPNANQILKSPDFEFLSNKSAMLPTDELFFQGKFLPFRQITQAKLDNDSSTKAPPPAAPEPRIWFVDDDPLPRLPKCKVMWKELLRLRKQKAALSSLLSSSSGSLGDHVAAMEEAKGPSEVISTREKHMRRIKKGLERTKSAANTGGDM